MKPLDTLRQSLEDILQRMNEMQQILEAPGYCNYPGEKL